MVIVILLNMLFLAVTITVAEEACCYFICGIAYSWTIATLIYRRKEQEKPVSIEPASIRPLHCCQHKCRSSESAKKEPKLVLSLPDVQPKPINFMNQIKARWSSFAQETHLISTTVVARRQWKRSRIARLKHFWSGKRKQKQQCAIQSLFEE